ncbi:MAG: hypothetical protein IPM47_14780 [Sphingobacteriales bacterium]|nr:MAG: hypothetical protein IPM47_14780 [Sphingobacteriales bacterium]
MKKTYTYIIGLFIFIVLFSCSNKENDTIEFYRKNRSIMYEVWQKEWRDTFKFGTRDYDTGIPFILDNSRNLLFIFDNLSDLYKINFQSGMLIDSINLLSGYTYTMSPQSNKLLYAYPALFFYHETILHFDIDFNFRAKYIDSINQEIINRFPETIPFNLDLDSVHIILPDKLWVRLNDQQGCIEEMIFSVNAKMEAPVIHSTFIVR